MEKGLSTIKTPHFNNNLYIEHLLSHSTPIPPLISIPLTAAMIEEEKAVIKPINDNAALHEITTRSHKQRENKI